MKICEKLTKAEIQFANTKCIDLDKMDKEFLESAVEDATKLHAAQEEAHYPVQSVEELTDVFMDVQVADALAFIKLEYQHDKYINELCSRA